SAPPAPPRSMTGAAQTSLPGTPTSEPGPPNVSPTNRPFRPPEGFSGPDSKSSRELGKSLERWFPKSMRDSPAMKNFIHDMTKKDWSGLENSRFWKEGKGPNVNWDGVGRGMKGTGRFLDRNLPSMGNRRLPDAPHVRAPNLPSGPNL